MTSVLTLAACLVFLSALTTQSVRAENADLASPSAGTIRFDLPPQPLAQALHAYGQLAGLAIMAETELLDGRTSGPVEGAYPVHEALQHLLAGTGLQASFPGANEVVIRLMPPGQLPAAPTESSTKIFASDIDGATDNGDYAAYTAMIQTRLTQALCESAKTRPGSYRLVVQLRIDNTGSVIASKMVSSTGLPARDTAIQRVMQSLLFDSAPPAGMQQPVTILLRPHADDIDTDCAQFGMQGS